MKCKLSLVCLLILFGVRVSPIFAGEEAFSVPLDGLNGEVITAISPGGGEDSLVAGTDQGLYLGRPV